LKRILSWLGTSGLLLLILAAAPVEASAQETDGGDRRPMALYAEIGGNGFYYSVNFEDELAPGWLGRVGLSLVPLDGPPLVAVPLLVQRLLGDGPHKLEVGLGVVPRFRDGRELWWTAAVGYRLLRENGVILRATLTPLVESNLDKGSLWVGVSFGKLL
jgi:hypothetical protein